MGPFITETWLRENFSLDHGSEVALPVNARLTPSAMGLLEERKISVSHVDDAGETVRTARPSGKGAECGDKRVNPLTGSGERHAASCRLCRQPVGKKPDTLTHLDRDTLVPKNDPRLKLRGKLDTLIARTVLLQEEFQGEFQGGRAASDSGGSRPDLALCLRDIRAALGNTLRAEVTGEPLEPLTMGSLDAQAIHAVSHNPLRHLGIDHLLPECGNGLWTARINALRAEVREAELIAADIFISRDWTVTRPDIMEGLNRLSSAVYVLMLLTHLEEQGKPVALERIRP